MNGGKAKQGTAMRILFCFYWYCLKYDVDFFAYMIRSGHNITPDFLSRANPAELSSWSKKHNMSRVKFPWWWKDLKALGPNWEWERMDSPLPSNLSLKRAALHRNGRIMEWNPTNAIFLEMLKKEGIVGRFYHTRSQELREALINEGFGERDGNELIVFGHPKTPAEVSSFLLSVRSMTLYALIMITPSEIIPEVNAAEYRWAQTMWLDAALYGGVFGGAWNVAISCKDRFDCVGQAPSWITLETVSDIYKKMDLKLTEPSEGVRRNFTVENSSARVSLMQVPGQMARYRAESQLAPITLRNIREPTILRPRHSDELLEVRLGEKIRCLGGLPFWSAWGWIDSSAASDALWRSYPLSISFALMRDILPRTTEGEKFDRIPDDDSDIPYRNGGVQPLTQRVRTALEARKYDALMSGIAPSTRKGYLRLWYDWVRFCALRLLPPWLTTEITEWGEKLIDFLMWLKEMVRIGAATCAKYVSAIRFFHIVSGYQDFTKVGQRYQIILKSFRRNRPSEKKYPASTDLLKYIYECHVNVDQQRVIDLELWSSLTLGFFFLLRSSEIRNIRHMDVMLGLDNNRPFITLFIQQSKTDQQRRGTFRTLYGVDSILFPAKAAVKFIASKRGKYKDDDKLFPEVSIGRIRDHLRLAAHAFGLPEHRFSCHSLRSGGATSLFVSGIPLSDIQRFGRWRSVVFHEYLRFGDLQYRHLSISIANAHGLTDQLRLAEESVPQTRFGQHFMGEDEEGLRFRTGGFGTKKGSEAITPKREMRVRPPGSSTYRSSAEEWNSVLSDTANVGDGRRHPENALKHDPVSVAQGYLQRSVWEGPKKSRASRKCSRSEEREGEKDLKAVNKERRNSLGDKPSMKGKNKEKHDKGLSKEKRGRGSQVHRGRKGSNPEKERERQEASG